MGADETSVSEWLRRSRDGGWEEEGTAVAVSAPVEVNVRTAELAGERVRLLERVAELEVQAVRVEAERARLEAERLRLVGELANERERAETFRALYAARGGEPDGG